MKKAMTSMKSSFHQYDLGQHYDKTCNNFVVSVCNAKYAKTIPKTSLLDFESFEHDLQESEKLKTSVNIIPRCSSSEVIFFMNEYNF